MRLEDMTREELWELFPIELVDSREEWAGQYAEMESWLKDALAAFRVSRISHIGSTAIPGIKSKPIIDVLVELDSIEDVSIVTRSLEERGIIKMSEDAVRASFNVGYTPEGYADKVYHIHLRPAGDNDELYFRDYLVDHAEIAKEYETLKLDLLRACGSDRDAYTEGKSDFVGRIVTQAKSLYQGRY